MGRRVERIVGAALAGGRPPSLPWSGTFHAVGARLLREYAPAIGLLPDFTILDREDSADLMESSATNSACRRPRRASPRRAPASSIYSRAVNAEAPLGEVLKEAFPWCLKVETGLRDLFAAYVETKQRQAVLDYDDLLLYWAGMMEDGGDRRRPLRSASITCWSTSTRTPTASRPRSSCASSRTGAA